MRVRSPRARQDKRRLAPVTSFVMSKACPVTSPALPSLLSVACSAPDCRRRCAARTTPGNDRIERVARSRDVFPSPLFVFFPPQAELRGFRTRARRKVYTGLPFPLFCSSDGALFLRCLTICVTRSASCVNRVLGSGIACVGRRGFSRVRTTRLPLTRVGVWVLFYAIFRNRFLEGTRRGILLHISYCNSNAGDW